MAEQYVTGYRRPDGRAGIRNHVVILPVDALSNAVCEAVARTIPGTLALPHSYGRLQYGDDLELTLRTLAGIGANPNVAAAVVIGIEPNWTNRIGEGIARTGKPVAGFSIERFGDLHILSAAARVTQPMIPDASQLERETIQREDVSM